MISPSGRPVLEREHINHILESDRPPIEQHMCKPAEQSEQLCALLLVFHC
jgi:hypothetical protein